MSDAFQIRQLREEDIPFAQTIRELAKWNQTDEDWLRLLEWEPEGCFLIEYEGKPAGTTTTTCYGTDLAWIGMVLVHPDFRQLGLATAMLEHGIRYLREERSVRCIKLDATLAGQRVYKKFGFQSEYELARWEGRTTYGPSVVEVGFDLARLAELDRAAFGADRLDFLTKLAADSRFIEEGSHGYGMMRRGTHAKYLGPVVADSPEAGKMLVETLLECPDKHPVYWDIPEDNVAAEKVAESLGFEKRRQLIRMRLGEPIEDRVDLQWGIGAPEIG